MQSAQIMLHTTIIDAIHLMEMKSKAKQNIE